MVSNKRQLYLDKAILFCLNAKLKGLIVALCCFGLVLNGITQTVPVGMPVLEDFERRQQLLGDSLHQTSLMIRPINRSYNTTNGVYIMPLIWKQQYNTDHPAGFNNGSMIPARGYQTLVSGGFFAKYGIFSVQLMPEFVFAQNLSFDGFPDDFPDKVWKVYHRVKDIIDVPDRFGDKPYKKVFLGQSCLRLTYKSVSLGLSSENLWWGPGMKNTLLMTNNAPGFNHITFNTVKPIKTPIGKFEWQILGGRLENSGYPGVDSSRLANHGLKVPVKIENWRYINSMTVSYSPKWFPGLSLGGVRSFTLYSGSIGRNYRTYLPLFEPFFKLNVGGIDSDTIPSDQIVSFFARWLMPESKAELYLEYGREDHSWDITDFILEPGHYRSYIIGGRKLVSIKGSKDEFIDIQFEHTLLGRNLASSLRIGNTAAVWYTHNEIRHGYTHYGQVLGAGIGTSSNMQSLNINWVKNHKKIGVEFYRLAHDEDFWAYISQVTGFGDYRTHWVDIGGAMVADWNYKNLLINFKLQTIGSINYMFNYEPIPSNPPTWWDRGKVRYNVHAELSLVYLIGGSESL